MFNNYADIDDKMAELEKLRVYLDQYAIDFFESPPLAEDMTQKQIDYIRKLHKKIIKQVEDKKKRLIEVVHPHCFLCDNAGVVYLARKSDAKKTKKFRCGCPDGASRKQYDPVPEVFMTHHKNEQILTENVVKHDKYVIENSREYFELLGINYDYYLPGGQLQQRFKADVLPKIIRHA